MNSVLKLYRRLTNKVRGKYENLVAPKNIILCYSVLIVGSVAKQMHTMFFKP